MPEKAPGRLAAMLQTLALGPWVLWKHRFADRQVTIALRQRLLGIIFVLSVAVYSFAPGMVTAITMTGLGLMLGLSFLWARQMALHVSARRRLRYHAVQVGDELEENLQLVNRASVEVLWAEIVDHSDLPGYSLSSVRSAGGGETLNWRVRTACRQRGVYQLGPWQLLLGDPLGLFTVTQTYFERREVLVYPPLAELPQRLLPHQRVTGDRRLLRQPLLAETSQALTARPYTPGDPLRHVHWRTTARREMVFTKQFEPEAASRVWLVPDFDIEVHQVHPEEATLETAVSLTAALAAQLLNDHLEVGLAAYADQTRILLPQRGPAHLWPLLLALAPLKAALDQPLPLVLDRLQPLIGPRDLVILITPSVSPDWPVLLRRLAGASHGNSASVYLIDQASYGGKQSAQVMTPVLAGLGIQAQVIQRGDVKIRAAAYGPLSRWEFKVLGTGRVIVQRAPTPAAFTASMLQVTGREGEP